MPDSYYCIAVLGRVSKWYMGRGRGGKGCRWWGGKVEEEDGETKKKNADDSDDNGDDDDDV